MGLVFGVKEMVYGGKSCLEFPGLLLMMLE